MKGFFKILGIIVFITIIGFSMSACSGDDDPFSGSWVTTMEGESLVLTFTGSTWTLIGLDVSDAGTFTVSGNVATLSAGGQSFGTATATAGTLLMTFQGFAVTFVRS